MQYGVGGRAERCVVRESLWSYYRYGETGAMKCPICQEPVAWENNSARPFCSARCRLLDLEGWLEGRYRVPLDEDNFEYDDSLERPES